MPELLALAGGSVDPRPLCCCGFDLLLVVAVVAAVYAVARNSAVLTAFAVLTVGYVGAFPLLTGFLPEPSPVVTRDDEVVDPDVVEERETFHAAWRQTRVLWAVSAATVGVLAAGLIVRRRVWPPQGSPAGPAGPG